MPVLRVRLLGGLSLTWDETPIASIPSAAARSLFAYLVTYRDRPHTRDLLAGTFWPELPDAIARRRLSQALWQIRHALRPHLVLLTEGDSVQLDPGLPLWLDVKEFEGCHALCTDKGPEALDRCETCLVYYQGEFLAGTYDDWLLPEREQLRELFLATLSHLVEGYKGRGDYERALAHARRLASEDPWREEAHREAMRLCHLLGRDAEALKQFEICRQVLARDLGVEPSPATTALAAEIHSRSAPAAQPLLPAAARPSAPRWLERPDQLPLVGRQQELGELLRQVEAAVTGYGGLTLVYGETGVGKTRLLQELADNAQWRGMRTLWGRCYELADPPAYQPLLEALRAGLRSAAFEALQPGREGTAPSAALPTTFKLTLEPLWRAELSRLLPELAAGESLPPPLTLDEEQRRLLEAIARAFLALGRSARHLVLLEDAHWMDPASLEALRYLLPRLADAPLMVVVSVRTEELAGEAVSMLSALENTRLARRLALDRLDLEATGELVRRALDLDRSVPRFSARLYAETEGNPFFLIETLRALVDEGLLRRDAEGVWSTPWDESTVDYAELPLPAGMIQSIERRLERLPVPLREPLSLAAVIGRSIGFDLWHLASGQSEEAMLFAGDELCARGLLLDVDTDADEEADYTFAHDQIRRVVYDQLSGPRRRAYHRRVAQALSHLSPDVPELLAHHWTQARVWDRAADCHQRAGERARAVYANAEAAAHYTQALEALDRLPGPADPVRRFELRLARESVHARLGRRSAQADDLDALEALLSDPALDTPARRLQVALRRVAFWEATSDYPAALVAAKRAVGQAQEAGDADAERQAHLSWGRLLRHRGELVAARKHLEQAYALSQATGNLSTQAVSLSDLGALHQDLGSYSTAQDLYQRALEVSQPTGDQTVQAAIFNGLGNLSHDLADYAAAVGYHCQALALRREIGDRRGEAMSLYNLSTVHHDSGDLAAARQTLEQVCDLAHAVGDQRTEGYAYTFLGLTLESLNELDAARSAYATGLELRRQVGLLALGIDALAGLARVATAQGDHDRAVTYAGEVLAWLEGRGIDGVGDPLLAYQAAYRALLAAGHVPKGRAALQRAYQLLMARAGQIDDEERRRAFLRDIDPNRGVWADYQAQHGHRVQVRLPRADASTGRPLNAGEWLEVTWTVAAPVDEENPNKTERRRQRLLRLLSEAADQGAAPTVDDLAAALGVSRATLKRDLAALRQAGHEVSTRGSRS